MMSAFYSLLLTSSSVSGQVADAITNVDLSGILSEVIALLPKALPIVCGFIGVRKGISFLIGSLRRA